MPSLNIEFTDEEHAGIKAAAEREGVSLKPFVHDAAVERASDHRRRVLDAARRSAAWSAELNDRLK
ncbi:antitoxin Phd [Gordonia sp. HNM0687]|uniref:Antitoxin Phd n=1 Tax=Gordonia mangrovi TaxID=2665643 RepID=A0A6L7GQW0_9ACTN|nr:antitoxin Phd [Gordonia mangrovi]MXP22012.1 antitoxin Phd [Gordonia mangrovi]UVF80721.1 antitoxin Phd [Gordonia mangrovi]